MPQNNSLEDGWIHQHKKNKARMKCVSFAIGLVLFGVIALLGAGEMYRIEIQSTVSKIRSTMHDRNSLCLSSIHIGHMENKLVVLASTPEIVLMNPTIYSTFGQIVKTNELANPPLHCVPQKKAYTIERKRYESISLTYTNVNASDILWPIKSLLKTKTTKTFTKSQAFCLQHIMEVLDQMNSCEPLHATTVKQRVEL